MSIVINQMQNLAISKFLERYSDALLKKKIYGYELISLVPLCIIPHLLYYSYTSEFFQSLKLLLKTDNVVTVTFSQFQINMYNSESLVYEGEKIVNSEKFNSILTFVVNTKEDIEHPKEFSEFINHEDENSCFIGLSSCSNICVDKKRQIFLSFIFEKGIAKKQDKYIITLSKRYDSIFNIFTISETKKNLAHKDINDFVNKCVDFKEKFTTEKTNDKLLLSNESECQELTHNKDLNKNIFIENREDIIRYVSQFKYDETETDIDILNAKKRYNKMGYTFKACMLIHGSPGCGKTSLIKGILSLTKRHGIVVNFGKIKNGIDFMNIFRYRIISGTKFPLSQLCFIFEDIDCFSNSKVLFKRELNDKRNEVMEQIDELIKNAQENKKTPHVLQLSEILNVLDGIAELTNAMIIFTTNRPSKFDPALTRPGRVDYSIECKKANINIIKEMICVAYDISLEELNLYQGLDNFKDYIISQASIQGILFETFDIQVAINKINCEIEKLIEEERIEQLAKEAYFLKEANKTEEMKKKETDTTVKRILIDKIEEEKEKLTKDKNRLNRLKQTEIDLEIGDYDDISE